MKQLNMRQLRGVFEVYLERIGRLEGEGEERFVKKEDNQYLIQLLDQHIKSNNYLIVIAIIILCFSFLAMVLLLLFSYRQNPETVKLVAGGAVFLALGAIRWLHRFWIQRTFIAISLTVLGDMPPVQAADIMTQFYWRFIRQPSKPLLQRNAEFAAKQEGTETLLRTVRRALQSENRPFRSIRADDNFRQILVETDTPIINQAYEVGQLNKRTTSSLSESRIAFYLFVSAVAGFILLSTLTNQEIIIALGTLNIAIIGTWIWASLSKIRLLTRSLK